MKETTLETLVRFHAAMTVPRGRGRGRGERGDVPGWVMVTVMTVGLAIFIFGVARDPMADLLTRAFAAVKPGE